MKDTCINITEDPTEEAEDLLLVFNEHGCWAEVGRQEGWQLLSLGKDCDTVGMAVHEIGHALGFWHTHSRYDRDDFITVLRGNIQRDKRRQFVKRSKSINNNYNLTYDYGSVMHYAATSFITEKAATKGRLAILPKDVNYTETLGSKFISFYDLLMMNMYYNCTDKCKTEIESEEKCENGGFAHPRNCSKCICPSGYGGQFCSERPPGCGAELNATDKWQTLVDTLNESVAGRDGLKKCNYWIKVLFDKLPQRDTHIEFKHDPCDNIYALRRKRRGLRRRAIR
ncbi:astacin [Teladorsagia circumcincta]|uniref:Metalloendopeptidase n=1 Tax=Teladorsagia circumcincta TaxID=45464 RepID=A0A2G9UN53_TELCI|nr:astacin [Teladorsagia circumcincta]